MITFSLKNSLWLLTKRDTRVWFQKQKNLQFSLIFAPNRHTHIFHVSKQYYLLNSSIRVIGPIWLLATSTRHGHKQLGVNWASQRNYKLPFGEARQELTLSDPISEQLRGKRVLLARSILLGYILRQVAMVGRYYHPTFHRLETDLVLF